MIKPFLMSNLNPQEVLNKLTGPHITEERAKNKKNDQIYLGPSLWFTLF